MCAQSETMLAKALAEGNIVSLVRAQKPDCFPTQPYRCFIVSSAVSLKQTRNSADADKPRDALVHMQ